MRAAALAKAPCQLRRAQRVKWPEPFTIPARRGAEGLVPSAGHQQPPLPVYVGVRADAAALCSAGLDAGITVLALLRDAPVEESSLAAAC